MNVHPRGLPLLLWRLILVCHICSTIVLLMAMGYIQPESEYSGTLQLQDAHAFIGVYFEYQLPAIMKDHRVEITEAGTAYLPSWLLYNKSSCCLEGIPTTEHEGFTYLHVSAPSSHLTKEDVFAVYVVFPGVSLHQTLTDDRSGREVQQDEYGLHYCKSFEARFSVTLMLPLSLESTTAEQRIQTVKNFSDFISKTPFEVVFSSHSRFSSHSSSVIHSSRGSKVLLSSLEENNLENCSWHSQISWHIACNSFAKADDLEQVLNHNIKSGTLENVLGCPIKGWFLLTSFPKDRRRKRQVNEFQTPFPTPTLTKALPSTLTIIATSRKTFSMSNSLRPMVSLTQHQTVTPSSLESTTELMSILPSMFYTTQIKYSQNSGQFVSPVRSLIVHIGTPIYSSFLMTSRPTLLSTQQYFKTSSKLSSQSVTVSSDTISLMSTIILTPSPSFLTSTQIISSISMTNLSSEYNSVHSSVFTNMISTGYQQPEVTSTRVESATLQTPSALHTIMSSSSESPKFSTILQTSSSPSSPSFIVMTTKFDPSGVTSVSPNLMTSNAFTTVVENTQHFSSSGELIQPSIITMSSFKIRSSKPIEISDFSFTPLLTTFIQPTATSRYNFDSLQSTIGPSTQIFAASSSSFKIVESSSYVVFSSPQLNTVVKTSRYKTLMVHTSQISPSLQPSPSDTDHIIIPIMSTIDDMTLLLSSSKFSTSILQSVQLSSFASNTATELLSSHIAISQMASNIFLPSATISSTPQSFVHASTSSVNRQSTQSVQSSQYSSQYLLFSQTMSFVSTYQLSFQTHIPSSSFKVFSSLQRDSFTGTSTDFRSLKTSITLLPSPSTISNEVTLHHSSQFDTSHLSSSYPSLTSLVFSSTEIQPSFLSSISSRSFATNTKISQSQSSNPRSSLTNSIRFNISHTLSSSSVVITTSSPPVLLFTTEVQSSQYVSYMSPTPPLVTQPTLLSTSILTTSINIKSSKTVSEFSFIKTFSQPPSNSSFNFGSRQSTTVPLTHIVSSSHSLKMVESSELFLSEALYSTSQLNTIITEIQSSQAATSISRTQPSLPTISFTSSYESVIPTRSIASVAPSTSTFQVTSFLLQTSTADIAESSRRSYSSDVHQSIIPSTFIQHSSLRSLITLMTSQSDDAFSSSTNIEESSLFSATVQVTLDSMTPASLGSLMSSFMSSPSFGATSVFLMPSTRSVFHSYLTPTSGIVIDETSLTSTVQMSTGDRTSPVSSSHQLQSVSSHFVHNISVSLAFSTTTLSATNALQPSFEVTQTVAFRTVSSMHPTTISSIQPSSSLNTGSSKVQTSHGSRITDQIDPSLSSRKDSPSKLFTTLSPSHSSLVSFIVMTTMSDNSHPSNPSNAYSLSQSVQISATPVLTHLPHLTSSPVFISSSANAMTLPQTASLSAGQTSILSLSGVSSQIVSSSYSSAGITTVPTDIATTTDDTPLTASVDRVPILLNPIDIISLVSGEVFQYHIPPDTFYDREDGDTRNLSLSLLDSNYRHVPSSSWILLDQETQSLKGIVVGKEYVSVARQFYLVATNSNGRMAYDALTVEVRLNEAEYTHQFQVHLTIDYLKFQEHFSNLYYFLTRLSAYYGEELSELNVFSVINGSVIVTYSNTSIPAMYCDLSGIQTVLHLMVNDNGSIIPAFQETLGKRFPVRLVKLKLTGRCVSFITTSPPDVTFSPHTARSKLWLSFSLAFVALLILLLCGFLICLYIRNKHPREEFLLSEERPLYIGGRKPAILANERNIVRNPRRTYPAILPDDINPFKSPIKVDVALPLKRLPNDTFYQTGGFSNPVDTKRPPVYSPTPTGRSSGGRGNPPMYQAPPPYFLPKYDVENKL